MTTSPGTLTPALRSRLADVMHAAHTEADARRAEVRQLRNVLTIALLAATLMVGALVLLGALRPASVPLCAETLATAATAEVPATPTSPAIAAVPATPAGTVCPAGGANHRYDIVLVSLFGLLGATIAVVAKVSTTSAKDLSYSPTVPQLALKLPAGVLTAIAATVLVRSGLFSVVNLKPSQAAILFTALLFGYAQQVFTRFVDQKANTVVEAAKPPTG
ncbi:hypothetical protein AB0M43_01255 [Longispora sp. NPDC051575]|uniref:hypothetical protein n=1 Tax=Longispora sp. NPDC051575 TaxID=3154943 RepID=UPI003446AB4C